MRRSWLIAVACAFVCVTLAAAPPRNTPVISTIDGGGSTDLTQTLQSDGLGPYVHTAKGTSGVESHIQEGGDYELDVYYFTSNRRLSYRFATENLVSGTPLASGLMTTKGRLILKCASSTNNMLTMVEGAILHCPMAGRFDWNNRVYLTRMGGVDHPSSTQPTIACTATSGGKCAAWTISSCQVPTDPDTGSCDNPGVMSILEERAGKGGKVTETWVADFTMQFRIAATKQQ
jgi:hypothetical protein